MRNGDSDSKTSIQSIERATQILRMFSTTEPRLTLGEISARLQLSKATGHRYVSALRLAGLLRYDEPTGTYTLGTLALDLAATAVAGLPVISIAEPVLARVVHETGETALLSIWDGESAVVVRVNDNSPRYITVRVREGLRLRAESAQSRIFLAHGLTMRDEKGETHTMPAEEATRVIEAGVQIHTNAELGVRTVAVPIHLGSHLAAVMAVIGTTATITDDPASPLVATLRRAAEDVSRGLPPTNGAPLD